MTVQTIEEHALALALDTARTNALLDAEKAVRDRIDGLRVNQLHEARALNNAADAIRDLRGKS